MGWLRSLEVQDSRKPWAGSVQEVGWAGYILKSSLGAAVRGELRGQKASPHLLLSGPGCSISLGFSP